MMIDKTLGHSTCEVFYIPPQQLLLSRVSRIPGLSEKLGSSSFHSPCGSTRTHFPAPSRTACSDTGEEQSLSMCGPWASCGDQANRASLEMVKPQPSVRCEEHLNRQVEKTSKFVTKRNYGVCFPEVLARRRNWLSVLGQCNAPATE